MLLCCHVEYDAALLKKAMDISLVDRREKAQKIKNERVKACSLAAGLLLKHGLFLCGQRNPAIKYAESGKPCLIDSPLHFSLSHSGEYAVCVIDDKPVGVDIQKVVEVSDRAVRRFCTEREQRRLSESRDYKIDVIRLWALKESWLKAAGKNTEDMFNASFTIYHGGAAGPDGFIYQLYEDIPGYIIAVCKSE